MCVTEVYKLKVQTVQRCFVLDDVASYHQENKNGTKTEQIKVLLYFLTRVFYSIITGTRVVYIHDIHTYILHTCTSNETRVHVPGTGYCTG